MASPQRNFPAPERRPAPELRLQDRRPVTPRLSQAKRDLILALITAAILGLWFVGWGWGNSGGWLWGAREMPAASDGQLNGPGVAILTVADKQEYIGQPFQVQNVPIDRRAGDRIVWIGQWHDSLPMMLLLNSGTTAGISKAQPGQLLDVTGTIVKAPATAVAKQQWQLGDEDLEQLAQQGVYIQAKQVRVVKR